jgi:hypothetical protein
MKLYESENYFDRDMLFVYKGLMPKPPPAPENEKIQKSVTIDRKLCVTVDKLNKTHRYKGLDSFSQVLSVALHEYLQAHHAKLLAEVEKQISDQYISKLQHNEHFQKLGDSHDSKFMVAEDSPKIGKKPG